MLDEIIRSIDDLVIQKQLSSVTLDACIRPALEAGIINNILSQELGLFENQISNSRRLMANCINLHEDEHFMMSVRFLKASYVNDPTSLTYGNSVVIAASQQFVLNLADKPLQLDTYQADIINPNVFERETICALNQSVALASGECVGFNAGKEGWTFSFPQDAVWLSITLHPQYHLDWNFSIDSCRALYPSIARHTESNLLVLLGLIEAIEDHRFAPLVRTLLSDNAHFIRWRAMQALAIIDDSQLMPDLISLGEDRHPEIQRAVRKTLLMMEQ